MTRDETNAFCGTLRGADCSSPFGPGHDVWKVGAKIFAIISDANTPGGAGLCVKTPDIETASLLIEAGAALKAPYLHRSWVMVPFGASNTAAMPDDELKARIRQSYDIIFTSLPRKTQVALG
jgi:predicted DNA-binding protein (MmcQ/YjbR family)